MHFKRTGFFLFSIFILTRCASAPPELAVADYQIGAALWHQTSGEFRALSYQAYNLARYRLDNELRKKHTKPPAVVVDVDQTVLDGAPYQAELVKKNSSYPDGWNAYVERADGEALPGAAGFLNYAANRGVKVFYVTNRKEPQRAPTRLNLLRRGFPNVDGPGALVLQSSGTSKENHRETIRKNYDVVLLIGDNLGDFDKSFDDKAIADRKHAVDASEKLFGSKYIVLPNTMYGAWEGAVYDYNWKLSPADRDKKRRVLLDGASKAVE
ncbi:MAG: 5'-nucleotidase, lipoprotein e(P4) family [Bdellovibrionales bacterium]|nr:5'-nucleotidase, lipoprotein e(P4) family [Bdellovibrionales bacterium]